MDNQGKFKNLRPLSLLTHLSNCYDSVHLQVSSNSVSWSIYLDQGKVTYATNSIDPFDRLERHLRRLSQQIPNLNGETRSQLRLLFEAESDQSIGEPDYQAICWLVSEQYLKTAQAAILIEALVKEVMESFLLIQAGTYKLGNKLNILPEFCSLELQPVLSACEQRLQQWQSLGPEISSPYQRPYFLFQTKTQQQQLSEIQKTLPNWMKGFSIRHLAVLSDQDELELAQNLYPYVLEGSVLLHEADPPFDRLPKTFEQKADLLPIGSSIQTIAAPPKEAFKAIPVPIPPTIANQGTASALKIAPTESAPPANKAVQRPAISNYPQESAAPRQPPRTAHKTYKIVCVDDSLTMLKEISYFLEDESFSVVTISNPIKALMGIIRSRPDLVLLDVNMAGIDGYELCRLLRNNSMFKKTPIVMVTGNKGLIDRVKAKMVGASGYLTKPFTRSELMKIVFSHLT